MRLESTIALTLLSLFTCAQNTWVPFPPMALQPVLKGNYGELRSNHFHSGIDLSTQGKIGQPVRASADGYVSRIKISEYGYGKAIYIDHPNGYTTVYGHLHRLAPAIEKLVTDEQYKQSKFSVELFPEKNQLVVRAGDTIAWSGNSGSSAGPHLHYEIRNTKSEIPLNPLQFIKNVKDTIPPIIKSISVYGVNKNFTETEEVKEIIPQRKTDIEYVVENPIATSALAGLGYCAVDIANDDSAVLGVYEMEMYAGGQLMYSYRMDDFSFDETRNINGHIDYSKKQHEGNVTEWCFRLPGNSFSQYRQVVNNGIIRMDSLKTVTLKLVLKDAAGNSSTCLIPLKYDSQIKLKPLRMASEQKIVFDKKTEIKRAGYRLIIPEGALFRNIFYHDSVKKGGKGFFSPKYTLYDYGEPLKKNLKLALRTGYSDSTFTNKLLLVKISDKGILSAENSFYKNGFVSGSISTFGTYAVTMDTVPPQIGDCTVSVDSVYNCPLIAVSVKDNLSGIKSYAAKINGNWYLSEYDYINDRILIYLTQPFEGVIKLELTVGDAKQNFSSSVSEINLQ